MTNSVNDAYWKTGDLHPKISALATVTQSTGIYKLIYY